MAIIVSNIRIGIDDPDMLAVEKAKRKLSVEDNRISEIMCTSVRLMHAAAITPVLCCRCGASIRWGRGGCPPHCRSLCHLQTESNISHNNRMHALGASDCCGGHGTCRTFCRIPSGAKRLLSARVRTRRTD